MVAQLGTWEGLLAEVVRQIPAIIGILVFLLAAAKGYIRFPQEVAALESARDSYKAWVEQMTPAVADLTVLLKSALVDSAAVRSEYVRNVHDLDQRIEANQAEVTRRLSAIEETLRRLAEGRLP